MTLMEHLTALQRALRISVGAWLRATIVSFIFWTQILGFLKRQAGIDLAFVYTSPTGAFGLAVKVALYAGLIFSAPVIMHQAWWFVSPGLHRRERRVALPTILATIFFFMLGMSFALLASRYILRVLTAFGGADLVRYLPIGDDYIGFLLALVIGFGLVFELPVILYVLGMMGIVKSPWLYKNRAYWYLGLGVLAQFMIPGSDPFTPFILFVPLIVFWESTALLLKVSGR